MYSREKREDGIDQAVIKRTQPVRIDESILQYELAAPINEALESGAWTQSIIWSPRTPFRDFTQVVEPEDDTVTEERPQCTYCIAPEMSAYSVRGTAQDAVRPKKRMRADNQPKDRFNISNDQYYEVSKEGRHRVRQTFGQLVVEHAYPAQKLQLPFVRRAARDMNFLFTFPSSSRPAFPSRKHVHFTDPRCNFLPISSFGLVRSVQLRRRKIRPVARLARVVMSAKVCTRLGISVSKTPATSSCGSSRYVPN